mmetsp:Transcript_93430/g.264524  ORF Transcript_93430/g.264524 Transcript_93430/m.264524 type:complete len:224 (+) Transcript_93430:69-740(+)
MFRLDLAVLAAACALSAGRGGLLPGEPAGNQPLIAMVDKSAAGRAETDAHADAEAEADARAAAKAAAKAASEAHAAAKRAAIDAKHKAAYAVERTELDAKAAKQAATDAKNKLTRAEEKAEDTRIALQRRGEAKQSFNELEKKFVDAKLAFRNEEAKEKPDEETVRYLSGEMIAARDNYQRAKAALDHKEREVRHHPWRWTPGFRGGPGFEHLGRKRRRGQEP